MALQKRQSSHDATSRWTRRALEHLLNALIVFSLTTIWRIQPSELTNAENLLNAHRYPLRTSVRRQEHITGGGDISTTTTTSSTTFLLGIFCTVNDTAARQQTRDTMLGPDLPGHVRSRLCSLQTFLNTRSNNQRDTYRSCQIIYTFVIGGNSGGPNEHVEGTPLLAPPELSNLSINNESDVIALNIKENMNKGKTPSWFNYASERLIDYGIDYVSKVDLDTLISIPQLLAFVQEELPPRAVTPPRVYGGVMMDFESCGGQFWPTRCQPVKGKVYMSGQFYFLSYDLVRHQAIWRTNRTFKERKQEDMAFGVRVWSYPHPIKLIAFNPRLFWEHGLKNETLWRGVYNNGHYKGAWNVNGSHIVNSIFKPPEVIASGLR